MENYYSIGEMSKLNNVSIETLRHYDRQNLLRPDHINEKTGYRYYSVKSFMKMDIIKKCRALGLSLDEIKEVMKDYESLESILEILKKQKRIVHEKLEELNNIKSSIEALESDITSALNIGVNKVYIKYNDERQLIKYDYSGRYTQEFEINLRKSLVDIENKYNSFNYQIVFVTSYDDLVNHNDLTYIKTLINPDKIIQKYEKIVTFPKGYYLTMYFDDTFYDTKQYYDIILKYINDHNIKVRGDFHEIYIITRANQNGEIKSLTQIEILIDDY